MESIISRFFLNNWQRKVVALLTAIVIWLFVNHSINDTKTISNIPIRIINLPSDKTIRGLLPNGMLSKRISLTLTGSKDVIDDLEPGDLEVLLDATTADKEEWVVHVSKKNLVSLNPAIDLLQHVNEVNHADFVIKLSRLVTTKIPVTIEPPLGIPPDGYEYLDIWPQTLYQSVNGPEEEVLQLKEKQLQITPDLADITKAELDSIKSSSHNDEINFPFPKKWKQVMIPFQNTPVELNDPETQNIHIAFLRKEFLPIEKEIPIHVFYPLENLEKINPDTFSLALNDDIQKVDGVSILTKQLYTRDVSRLFVDVIRNSIEIVIVAAPNRTFLAWYVNFIYPHDLEATYVAIANSSSKGTPGPISRHQEELLRRRFRDYMQKMTLYTPNGKKLKLNSTLDGNQIKVIAN